MSKRIAVCAAVVGTIGIFSAVASASVNQHVLAGSACSYADNPLASHNKIHHRFTNTSGSNQWITCPIEREQTGYGIELAIMEISGTASSVRLEQRDHELGSLTGWNAETTKILSGGNAFKWFEDGWGDSVAWGAYSFEARLNPNAFVSWLFLQER